MRLSAQALVQLNDLRMRLLRCAALMGGLMVLLYLYKEQVLGWLVEPLLSAEGAPEKLLVTSLTDTFFLYLKMVVWGGVFLIIPYVLWELWQFISPGLYKRERQQVLPLLIAMPVLFYAGGLFSYFIVTPAAIAFFLDFGNPLVAIIPTLKEYLAFLLGMGFAFGLTFNFPVLLVGLMRLGVLSPATLAKQRRLVIILIFVVAAILTPTPDPVTQCMLAIPLWLFYEVALLIGRKPIAI